MNVEQMIGWTRNTDDIRARWIGRHGEYREQADVDDMLDWLNEEGFCLDAMFQSKTGNGHLAVFFLSPERQFSAHGSTIKQCFINAVETWYQSKRVSL